MSEKVYKGLFYLHTQTPKASTASPRPQSNMSASTPPDASAQHGQFLPSFPFPVAYECDRS
ncbi:MAG: hypothetical protein KME40_33400 [Komarekiella atlantica HA4396-MV6]|nr:hypothetical protein [Komarekiella atlantica HA4396-MV6]